MRGSWNSEGCGDDLYLPEAVVRARLENDSGDAGINRQAGHDLAVGGQVIAVTDCPKLAQEGIPVAYGVAVRWIDKGELGGIAETERDHLQDDLGQISPLDLRQGEFGPALVILVGVESDADAGAGPAAAAFALVAIGLGDPAYRQADGLGPGIIIGDAGKTCVDHISDAGNSDRGLGNVGGHDDLRSAGRIERCVSDQRPAVCRTSAGPRRSAIVPKAGHSTGGYPFRLAERQGYRRVVHGDEDL